MQLKWTDLAAADLDHIEEFISAANSPVIAIDAVLRIIDTVALVLIDHPEAGRLGRVKGTRELVIDDLPFVVVYRQVNLSSQVQILRVLHEAQQWPTET